MQHERLLFVQFLIALSLFRILLGIDSHFQEKISLSASVYSRGNALVFWAITQAHELVVGGCCFVHECFIPAS